MQAASLDVQLGSRSYPIHIGSGLLDNASLFGRHLGESRAVIVTVYTPGATAVPAIRPFTADSPLTAGVNDTVYVRPDLRGSLNAAPAFVASYANGTPTIAACATFGDTTATGSVFGVTVGVSIATGLVVTSPAHAVSASDAVMRAISLKWGMAEVSAVESGH